MADYSMSDMPWLGKPADPAGSLARGIDAGAQIANVRAQRGALALRQMEHDLNRQQVAAQLAQLPLKMTLQEQAAQMNALNIQTQLEDRQQFIRNTEDLLNLRSRVSAAFSETDDPPGTLRMLSLEAITQNPYLGNDPRFKAFSAEVGNLANETEGLLRAQAYRERYEALASASQDKQAIDRVREDRLQKDFEFRKQREEQKVPQHRLSEFRAKARVIENDLSLIGNAEEKMKRLDALAREFESTVPQSNLTPAAPSANAPTTLDIGRFKVTPLK